MARALSLCGPELPRTLMAGNAFNEDGHWESEVVKTSNDALLRDMDSAWDDALALRSQRAPRLQRSAIETLKATVRDQFPLDRDVIIKDPRISLLFPAWKEALDELGFEVCLVVLVRHPLEVAASLTRRDSFPATKSALLWLTYFLSIERDSRDTRRVFLTYDDLLTDWRSSLRRVERLTGASLPRWNDTAELEVDKFLSNGRRHHHYDLEAFRLRSDIPSWVMDTYRWALAASRTEEEPASTTLDVITDELVATADTYAPLVAYERRKAERLNIATGVEGNSSASLYYAIDGGSFSQSTTVSQRFELLESPTVVELTTPALDRPISALRLDPDASASEFRLHGVRLRASDGATLWQWDGSDSIFAGALDIRAHRTTEQKTLLQLTGNDPQIALPTEAIEAHRTPVTVELIISRAEQSDVALLRQIALEEKLHVLGSQIETLGAQSLEQSRAHDFALEQRVSAAIEASAERAAISVRREFLPDLARAIDTARSSSTEASNAAAELEARIQHLSTQVGQLLSIEQRLAAQQDEYAKQTRLIEQMRAEDREARSRAEHAAHAREEQLRNEIHQNAWNARHWQEEAAALRASTSWKITAPLRALTPRSLISGAKSVARPVRDALVRLIRGPSRPLATISHFDPDSDAALLASSPFFDPAWYLAEYSDVAQAGADPLQHYLNYGGYEGRAPGPCFDSRWYLTQNTDVQAAGVNPLTHFIRAGRRERRAPLPPTPRRSLGGHLKLFTTLRQYKFLLGSAALAFEGAMPLDLRRRARRWTRAHAPVPPTVARKLADGGALFTQLFSSAVSRGDIYVPLAASSTAVESRIRAIAFYLPQFHPIPENDAWWGKGFTEWTNVSKAVPQFVGHYQPRIPDELGFYDLRIVDVQRRQVELAKQFGLGGFCFHYYWFSGRKRLLERPLNQYLAAKDIDFPYCVCWANENWTRRWDGLDEQVLMAQRHEPEDDLAFIEDLAPVLRDPRYIRINGRPLLIVYRAGILPRPQQTLQVWREYCRANGIGDLYIVAAQTFGLEDPRGFGFDAAVEFPPHKIVTGEIQNDLEILNPGYEGRVFSYEDVARKESVVSWPEYKLFKTVMPSWDNEARKPGKGHVFTGSTPEIYRNWIESICRATDERHVGDEKLVFINAWNEWAEGAYLEPDRQYGYAYLDSTRSALSNFPAPVTKQRRALYVIVHAFYPDVFAEMLAELKAAPADLHIIATCPADREDAVRRAFEASGLMCPFELIVVENRGRDVLAFLEALRRSSIPADAIILKVHTKVTQHRLDGSDWRRSMLDSLMLPAIMSRVLDAFVSHPTLSLVAPAGYIVPLKTYIGENQPHIDALLRRGGWPAIQPETDVFAAGTMFFVRRSSLDHILKLSLEPSMFEEEAGQKDGTVAHALERLITMAIRREGGEVSDTQALIEGRDWQPNENFDFAVKTPYLYQG